MILHHRIIPLYRAYLRQVRQLPHHYIRQFFRIKASYDFRRIVKTNNTHGLQDVKIKRISKELRKIQAANQRNSKAFAHILDLAYGRKGRLRWEIMEPLLSDPAAPIPPRIIPTEEKSRPPVYSPELRALLTSNISRTTKALDHSSLNSPPTLPTRADPTSEEARLLGRLSKRREVNIRWRYFVREWKKVRPPLQVNVTLRDQSETQDAVYEGTSTDHTSRVGIRALPMQHTGVLEEVKQLVGPAWIAPSPTRRERQNNGNKTSPLPTRLPIRWLRRRYQELLGRIPILTYSGVKKADNQVSGNYSISLAPNAITHSQQHGADRLAEVDDIDLAWVQLADSLHIGGNEKGQNSSKRIYRK